MKRTNSGPAVNNPYTVSIAENNRTLSVQSMADPFHNTTIHPRGWKNALRLLFRRYKVNVVVSTYDPAYAEQVMELNPNYIGPPGSKSRERWNKELDASLHDFADRISDDGEELAPPKTGPFDE